MSRGYDEEGWSQPGDLPVGQYVARELAPLTQKENAKWRRELAEREARRIPLGFSVPIPPSTEKRDA